MTVRRACPVCLSEWAEPDHPWCAGCAFGRTPTAGNKSPKKTAPLYELTEKDDLL